MGTLKRTFKDGKICCYAHAHHEYDGDEDVRCSYGNPAGKHFCLGKCQHFSLHPTTKLSRIRWHCGHCNDVAVREFMIRHVDNFCAYCGSPLTEEALEELENRVVDASQSVQ